MNLSQWLIDWEKAHYPFRNYPRTTCGTLLFPGCSFPAQFPRTMAALAEKMAAHGVPVAYDCCGKPVAELGRRDDAGRIAGQLAKRLTGLGVQELVCICPNCAQYLQETLDVPVISVYALLRRWGYDFRGAPPAGVLFRPCPDRRDGALAEEIGALCPLEGLRELERVPCCGLRGDIAAHGPQAGAKLCGPVKEQAAGERIYTYCASCSGQFQRHGCGQVAHLLSLLLGVEEAPDAAHALWNRARTKFIKQENHIDGNLL